MEIVERSNLLNPATSIDDDDIPDWLLFEILLRLPIKSVFKCIVVSKRWLSVASDRYFIRAYASRASTLSRPPWIVLSQTTLRSCNKIMPKFVHNPPTNCYFISPRALYLGRQPHVPGTYEHFSIEGLSEGLVLYSCSNIDKDHYDFYVCNPITGHRTDIPARLGKPDGVPVGSGFLTRVDEEFTLKSYRIVQAMHDPSAVIFSVYYSEIGDWRKFRVKGPGPYLLDLQKSAAVLDGILYWADRGGYVIVYDPEAKPGQQVRFNRDPDDEEKLRFRTLLYAYSCFTCRGELRYFGGCDIGIPEFNIWKLQDLSSWEWCLVHKIEKTYIHRALGMRNTLEIVCLDPFDSDVVYLLEYSARSVFSYNMKSGMLANRPEIMIVGDDGPFRNRTLMFPCTLELVVPPWPTVVAEKHLERRIG